MNTCAHTSIHSTSVSQSFVPVAHDTLKSSSQHYLHIWKSHITINRNSHMNEGKCAKCIHSKTLWNCYSHTKCMYTHRQYPDMGSYHTEAAACQTEEPEGLICFRGGFFRKVFFWHFSHRTAWHSNYHFNAAHYMTPSKQRNYTR